MSLSAIWLFNQVSVTATMLSITHVQGHRRFWQGYVHSEKYEKATKEGGRCAHFLARAGPVKHSPSALLLETSFHLNASLPIASLSYVFKRCFYAFPPFIRTPLSQVCSGMTYPEWKILFNRNVYSFSLYGEYKISFFSVKSYNSTVTGRSLHDTLLWPNRCILSTIFA